MSPEVTAKHSWGWRHSWSLAPNLVWIFGLARIPRQRRLKCRFWALWPTSDFPFLVILHPSTTNYHCHRFLDRSHSARPRDGSFSSTVYPYGFWKVWTVSRVIGRSAQPVQRKRRAPRLLQVSASSAQSLTTIDIPLIDVDEPFI